MTPRENILRHISRDGRGIEIGPSHNPIASKKDGFNVTIIDTLTREGLRAKYKDHNVNLENIEEVDYVWKGESYKQLLNQANCFDWIIASHVIEHTPDLIAFLNDCADLLVPNGVLSLAIPDKRYCFDHFRPVSGISQVIDKHLSRATCHSAGSIVEFMLNAVWLNGQPAWSSGTQGEWTFSCPIDEVRAQFDRELTRPTSMDVHSWCFTPASFGLMIHDLNLLGLIRLRELFHSPTEGCEFAMILSVNGNASTCDRLDLLKQIESEVAGRA
jgi:SAM-dependent methyltransferase